MSGSTKAVHRGEFFAVSRETPCINFAINPDTGESGEAAFHQRAEQRFARYFARCAARIDEKMATFRAAFADRVPFAPYAEVPVPSGVAPPAKSPKLVWFTMAPATDLGVDVAVRRADGLPTKEMQAALRALFMIRVEIAARDYGLAREIEALPLDDPRASDGPATAADEEQRARALEARLSSFRGALDAVVARLTREAPVTILPYDAARPLRDVGARPPAPCRFELLARELDWASVLITLAAPPSAAEYNALAAKFSDLLRAELEQRKPPPV